MRERIFAAEHKRINGFAEHERRRFGVGNRSARDRNRAARELGIVGNGVTRHFERLPVQFFDKNFLFGFFFFFALCGFLFLVELSHKDDRRVGFACGGGTVFGIIIADVVEHKFVSVAFGIVEIAQRVNAVGINERKNEFARRLAFDKRKGEVARPVGDIRRLMS